MGGRWVRNAHGFERRLGPLEEGFYWDSIFNGTADTVERSLINVAPSHRDVVSDENVLATWLALKQKFPLLGSRLEERNETPYFIVQEDWLKSCINGNDELSFMTVQSLNEAEELIYNLVTGYDRKLSNDCIARLIVIHVAEAPDCAYFAFMLAHCMSDGVGSSALVRSFLDTLSDPEQRRRPKKRFEDMLYLSSPTESLLNSRGKSKARLRWQAVLGKVLLDIRNEKMKGGHTLPRNFTESTLSIPASSALILKNFSRLESDHVIRRCRSLGLTFGSVLPVLGQVSLTRLLCRRYTNSEISEPEWEYRKTSPMFTGGPINIRPFLSPEWNSAGGKENLCLAIGFYHYNLPFMPLGECQEIKPGDPVPKYLQLLSQKRFELRARILQGQAVRLLKHPRLLNVGVARAPQRIERTKTSALNWRSNSKAQPSDAVRISDEEIGKTGPVFAHGGSSIGNRDLLIPLKYPFSSLDKPTLTLESSIPCLHCRPAELYLGAFTMNGLLHFIVYFDKNVYEENLTREWLEEVVNATMVYLMDDLPSKL